MVSVSWTFGGRARVSGRACGSSTAQPRTLSRRGGPLTTGEAAHAGERRNNGGPGPARSEAECGKGHDRLEGGRWRSGWGAWRDPCKRSERRGGAGPRPHGGAGRASPAERE